MVASLEKITLSSTIETQYLTLIESKIGREVLHK